MIKNIPIQVFSKLGFNMDNPEDKKFLKNKYKEKTKEEILACSKQVFELKRNKTPIWSISFFTGLSTDDCRGILSGSINNVREESVPGYTTRLEIDLEYSPEISELVERKIYPFDNVRRSKKEGAKKVFFNKSDVYIGNFIYNSHISLKNMPRYANMDTFSRTKLRNRAESAGILAPGARFPVKRDDIPQIEEMIDSICTEKEAKQNAA